MNIPIAMTLKGIINGQNLDYVPANGELLIDKETNLLKIGDGKTKVADLPYVSNTASHIIGIDLAPQEKEYIMTPAVKHFIEEYKHLIVENEFDEFYENIGSRYFMKEITKALLHAGINPKPYLTIVPPTIKDMLND